MDFNFELTINLLQLGLILIILGLLLNNWKPPIKPQYVFIILGTAGIFLGYILGCGVYWGFIGAGLVFYKGMLVEEFKLVKESLTNIKEMNEITSKPQAEEPSSQVELKDNIQ